MAVIILFSCLLKVIHFFIAKVEFYILISRCCSGWKYLLRLLQVRFHRQYFYFFTIISSLPFLILHLSHVQSVPTFFTWEDNPANKILSFFYFIPCRYIQYALLIVNKCIVPLVLHIPFQWFFAIDKGVRIFVRYCELPFLAYWGRNRLWSGLKAGFNGGKVLKAWAVDRLLVTDERIHGGIKLLFEGKV